MQKQSPHQQKTEQPSKKLKQAAAQLRVNIDNQVRRPTPQWIKDLANKKQ